MQADAAISRDVVENASEQNSNNIAVQMLASYLRPKVMKQFIQTYNEDFESLIKIYLTQTKVEDQRNRAKEQLLSLLDENVKSEVKEKLEKCSAVLQEGSMGDENAVAAILDGTQETIEEIKSQAISDPEVAVTEEEHKGALQDEEAIPESSVSMDRDEVLKVAEDQAKQVINAIDANTNTTPENQENMPDYVYLMQALNPIHAQIYKLTDVTKNLRFFNPTNTPVLTKNEGGNYRWDYKQDSGSGLASLMARLFPSSGGNLNTNSEALMCPVFARDCKPTPELMAQIFKIIYDYRNADISKKEEMKQQFAELTKGLELFSSIKDKKDKQKVEQTAESDNYDKVSEFVKLMQRFDSLAEKSCQCFSTVQVDPVATKRKTYLKDKTPSAQFDMLNALRSLSDKKLSWQNEKKCEQQQLKGEIKKWFQDVIKFRKSIFPKGSNITYQNLTELSQELYPTWQSKFNEHYNFLFEETYFQNNPILGENIKVAKARIQFLRNIFEIIDTQEYSDNDFDPNEPDKILPKFTPETMLMCFFLDHFNSEEDLTNLFTKAQNLILCPSKNADIARVFELLQEQQNTINLLHEIKTTNLSPYKNKLAENPTAYALSVVGNDGNIKFEHNIFADCADTAARHLVNLLAYSVDGNWNLLLGQLDESEYSNLDTQLTDIKDAINTGGNFEFLHLADRLKLFFYHQSIVGADATDEFTQTLWEYAICNMNAPNGATSTMNDEGYYYIRYSHNKNYELDTGFINTLKLMYNIAKALNLSDETNLEAARDEIDTLQKQATQEENLYDQTEKAARLTFSLFNPNVNINVRRDKPIEKFPTYKDIAGKMQITCTSEVNRTQL